MLYCAAENLKQLMKIKTDFKKMADGVGVHTLPVIDGGELD